MFHDAKFGYTEHQITVCQDRKSTVRHAILFPLIHVLKGATIECANDPNGLKIAPCHPELIKTLSFHEQVASMFDITKGIPQLRSLLPNTNPRWQS